MKPAFLFNSPKKKGDITFLEKKLEPTSQCGTMVSTFGPRQNAAKSLDDQPILATSPSHRESHRKQTGESPPACLMFGERGVPRVDR